MEVPIWIKFLKLFVKKKKNNKQGAKFNVSLAVWMTTLNSARRRTGITISVTHFS